MEKPTDPYVRPRTRRVRAVLDACQDCANKLTDDNWSPSNQAYKRYTCRPCWAARQKRYQDGKPGAKDRAQKQRVARELGWSDERKVVERTRIYGAWLKHKYGITIETYAAMYKEQNGACAICKTEKPSGKGCFHVDHCHTSGDVRALLCAECNIFLGLAKDNPATLRAAAAYLEHHNAAIQKRADHKMENRAAVGGKTY